MSAPLNEPHRSIRNNWNNQVRRHALMQPDATALRFQGATITWAQLDSRVGRFAGVRSRRGVGSGDPVLILVLNRPQYHESLLAIKPHR
ncbi:MAG: AMP-binding protein, partial [Rhodococcus fascians]